MSIESTSESNSLLPNEMSDGSSTNTLSLFEDSFFNYAHDAFEVHLDKDPVEQNILDRCLMSGLHIVRNDGRELSRVTPTLLLLLKFGAQWINNGTRLNGLLENGMTPYHLICQSSGDHHELLNVMLLSSGRALIDHEDCWKCTAMVYAIRKANINYVRSLLKSGANVNHNNDNKTNCPLAEAMYKLVFEYANSGIIETDIFDLLLASGADVNKPCDKDTPPPVLRAHYWLNFKCVKKLIQRGARLGWTAYGRNYVWVDLVRKGNIEVLKNVIKHGIDKDSTDTDGKSMLRLVIESGDIEAIRYLLDLGVTLPTYQQEAELKPCKKCGTNRLHIRRDCEQSRRDPCIAAIIRGSLDVSQMLEKHGTQSFNSFNVIMNAVMYSPNMIEYLLNKYTYPLNIEYTTNDEKLGIFYHSCYRTLLMEACYLDKADVTKMLLDHGADPNKRMCEKECFSAINIAIRSSNVNMVAHLVRSGLDVNYRSYHWVHGYVLPFEAAVLDGKLNATKMLLVSGCSCGVYSLNSNHKFKANIKLALEYLMRKWKVDSNNVNSLELQCRRTILKYLSPQAHKKIKELPLPHCIIKYLSIPELDDMMTAD